MPVHFQYVPDKSLKNYKIVRRLFGFYFLFLGNYLPDAMDGS